MVRKIAIEQRATHSQDKKTLFLGIGIISYDTSLKKSVPIARTSINF
jgi:hypothetical protein